MKTTKRYTHILVIVCLSCISLAHATDNTISARCIEAADGDTLRVETDEGEKDVHLWGIDAPELAQIWGPESKANLNDLAQGQTVRIDVKKTDTNGIIAIVSVAGDDLARQQIESGYAWLADTGGSSEEYVIVLWAARGESRSMWADSEEELVHPAQWREAHRVRPTPRPTATPRPSTLSDIAHKVDLPGGDGEESVKISGIPTKGVYKREKKQLIRTFDSLRYKARSIAYYMEQIEKKCSETEGSAEAGSYWSEEDQEWKTEQPVQMSSSCKRYYSETRTKRKEIEKKKRAAINQALRFGIKQGEINRLVRNFGLEAY